MPNENLFYYKYIAQTILAWLEQNDLFYTFDLPLSTSVTDLIRQIAMVMQNSSSSFSFTSAPSYLSFISNEVLPLQLLEFNNRGLPQLQDQQIRLHCAAFTTYPTLSDLPTDCYHFAIPKLVIDGNNRFVLHFSKLSLTILSLYLIFIFIQQLHGPIHLWL